MMLSWIALLIGGGLICLIVLGLSLIVRALSGGSAASAPHPQAHQSSQRSGGLGKGLVIGTVLAFGIAMGLATLFLSVKRVSSSDHTYYGEVPTAVHFATMPPSAREMPLVPVAARVSEIDSQATEDEEATKALLNQITEALDTARESLADSRVPMGSVAELVRLTEQLRSSLYQQEAQAKAESEAEAAPVGLLSSTPLQAEVPMGTPTWALTGMASRTPNMVVVKGGPSATAKISRAAALKAAAEFVMGGYRAQNQGADNWTVDLDRLPIDAIAKEHTEQLPWDFSAGTDFAPKTDLPDTAYKTYMAVRTSPDIHSAIYQQWKQDVSETRLERVAITCGGLVAAVALLALYYRIESHGFWRRGLKFASLMTAGSVGMISVAVGLGADGPGLTNHVGPAKVGGSHLPDATVQVARKHTQPRAHRQHGVRKSTFAGIPVHGNRVGFVVLGDKHFSEDGKVDLVSDEITRCIEEFEKVDFRIFLEAERKFRRVDSDSQSHDWAAGIRRAVSETFDRDSESAFPRNSVRNMLQYRPDEIVLIRDASADIDSGNQLTSRTLAQLFGAANVPVHTIEIGKESSSRLDMSNVATQTGGTYLLWNAGK